MKDTNNMGITEGAEGAEGADSVEIAETAEKLSQRVRALEAEVASMRAIVLRVAEARMCRDNATMMESCPHCSLKRGGEYGYGGQHDATCIVAQARALGF